MKNTAQTDAGKVAFLFSGQGSQYAGMLRPLVDAFAPARDAMERIDVVLRRLDLPTFEQIAWGGGDALGSDVWLTQLSLLCADLIVYCSLESLQIAPDCVAGHSYGEFPALVAAGAWDFETAVKATRARCGVIEACCEARGRMLSIAAPGAIVEQLRHETNEPIYLANRNAPNQTVVGGESGAVLRFQANLTARRIATQLLPVPRPYHTPLMRSVERELASVLESIVVAEPRTPILSSVTNRFVTLPEEIRENLVVQITRPVDYVDLIEQLADEGVRIFVEVGPRRILTGLHRKILRGREAVAVGCDDRHGPGLQRLIAVRTLLETRGFFNRPRRHRTVDIFASPTPAYMPPGR
ncbi:MAG TPA: hypothetical protein DD670_10535 [Planctomycetaceae bacterium]|nr:hypothetical protein [Planctomycetaceae bacterium]